MEFKDKYLPIGSIVLLKGGTKKAMVTGFCSITEDDTDKIYDYTGCVYPEGFLDFDQICLFDHSQIEKIYHIGYVDDEEQEFKKELVEMANRFETGEESTTTFFNDYINDEEDDIELQEVKKDVIDDFEYL